MINIYSIFANIILMTHINTFTNKINEKRIFFVLLYYYYYE